MFMPAIITGCIILSAGVYITMTGHKKTRLLEKYELEHRSSDGIVQFDSVQLFRTHTANKNLYRVIMIMGAFTGLFGVILLGYGFNFFDYFSSLKV